jgi:hypothetical protein
MRLQQPWLGEFEGIPLNCLWIEPDRLIETIRLMSEKDETWLFKWSKADRRGMKLAGLVTTMTVHQNSSNGIIFVQA